MKCLEESCENEAKSRGMCHMHYMRNYRLGDRHQPEYVKCRKDGCEDVTSSKSGLCVSHYKQRWYLNKLGRDKLIVRTSEERWIHSVSNYVMIKVNGELVYEHRVIAEKALGKPLPKGVVIHHTSEPWDNHGWCKLVICPDQAYHLLIHRRAKELGYENN